MPCLILSANTRQCHVSTLFTAGVVYVNPMDMWGILMLTLLDIAILLASSTPNIVFTMTDDLGWGDVQYMVQPARQPY